MIIKFSGNDACSGRGGRRFKSCHSDQQYQPLKRYKFSSKTWRGPSRRCRCLPIVVMMPTTPSHPFNLSAVCTQFHRRSLKKLFQTSCNLVIV